ncbi:MAG: hypothetical protein M3Z17_09415 [Gemmatimonadota bacterium]|nr:hypothetical protein [Gemmatimonadota bacterium]
MFSISPFMIPITAIIMAGLFPLLRAWAKKIERASQTTMIPAEVTSRLERIEQAVEAVAIEVERISEGQRFTTKLLSEAKPEKTAVAPQ